MFEKDLTIKQFPVYHAGDLFQYFDGVYVIVALLANNNEYLCFYICDASITCETIELSETTIETWMTKLS